MRTSARAATVSIACSTAGERRSRSCCSRCPRARCRRCCEALTSPARALRPRCRGDAFAPATCSEVASAAYEPRGIRLWQGLSSMSTPGVVGWLGSFGVRHFTTQAPADLEYDPQLVVVAEWRDPEALARDHVHNAIIDAMLEEA